MGTIDETEYITGDELKKILGLDGEVVELVIPRKSKSEGLGTAKIRIVVRR